jgi:hypothetical protein
MPCKYTYACAKPEGKGLVIHNVRINEVKWHFADNNALPEQVTKEEILEKIRKADCRSDQLIIAGFTQGWIAEC